MTVLGLDVGGAALKAADTDGVAAALRFPLWRHPERLPDALRELTARWKPGRIALTMTGELCDCFRTKADGVACILDAVETVFPSTPIAVFQTNGGFVAPPAARKDAWSTAASNWLALAMFAARVTDDKPSLVIDVGSTTTDLIAIANGAPVVVGRTDSGRLSSGELVYQGVERTPLCALLPEIDVGGVLYSHANEFFATTLDAYLLLGDLPEEPDNLATADGKPATVEFAHERIARTIASDRTRFSLEAARHVARQVAARQRRILAGYAAVVGARLAEPPRRIILSGQGEWLGRRIAADSGFDAEVVSLAEKLGEALSKVAPAYAVACLAA